MGVVTTIKEKCRRCYTCVRECPAKAIKVVEGQATVIEERCIACGNCVKVCKQGAKSILSHKEIVYDMLENDGQVIACLAPSFPAAFDTLKPGQVVAGARALGFSEVWEVALGAALVSAAYEKLVRQNGGLLITTPCPAIVGYVEKYLPQLVPRLAPVVSPMIALARALRSRYGGEPKIVFIGPCIAKKVEMEDKNVAGLVSAVLTFKEFTQMLEERNIDLANMGSSDFDGPDAGVARSFPISGGLLKSSGLSQDVLEKDIIVSEGKERAIPLLREARRGNVHAKLLDVLFCEGCIAGPKMLNDFSTFRRREIVADYVKWSAERANQLGKEDGRKVFADVDMSRAFTADDKTLPYPSEEEITAILRKMRKFSSEDELDCGACGYPTCREKSVAVCQGLAEPEMCLPYLIEGLEDALADLESSHKKLKDTRDQLIQAERLAGMGQLSAGVAHELNNPLGSILLYAHLLLKQLKGKDKSEEDVKMIMSEATRCKNIVRDLLNFSRQGSFERESTDINEILEKSLEALSAAPGLDDIKVVKRFDRTIPSMTVDGSQLQQVFVNLISNAVWAMKDGGTLTLTTRMKDASAVEILVQDTGCGIPEENLKKLFTPFFTTKKMGEGTGLGLAISYGILKMHSGQISVESAVGEGTTFRIELPLAAAQSGVR